MNGYFVNYLDFVVHIMDLVALSVLIWGIFAGKLWNSRRFWAGLVPLACFVILEMLLFGSAVNLYFSLRLSLFLSAALAVVCAVGMMENRDQKKIAKSVVIGLALAGIIQSIIIIAQVLTDRAIGLGFLGESAVSVGSYNASSVYLGVGTFLRGYGTFPHPNMAGFFLAGVIVVLAYVSNGAKKGVMTRIIAAALLCLVGLVLTWSRSAILLCIVSVGGLLILRNWSIIQRSLRLIVPIILVLVCGFGVWLINGTDSLAVAFRERFVAQSVSSDISVVERTQLVNRAKEMIFEYPLTGVGIGGFIPAMSENPIYTEQKTRLMQPVHNVPLLVLAEIGIIGVLVLLPYFVVLMYKTRPGIFAFALGILLAVGLMDHFLWSLPQGLAMGLSILTAVTLVRRPASG